MRLIMSVGAEARGQAGYVCRGSVEDLALKELEGAMWVTLWPLIFTFSLSHFPSDESDGVWSPGPFPRGFSILAV